MVGRYIRLIVAGILCIASVALFVNSFVAWGVLLVFFVAVLILLHFKNEMNLLAFYLIRKNKFVNAESILSKVEHPEKLIKSQEAYYYFLSGLIESQQHKRSKAEKSFKKALSTGLRMTNDQAMAKLNLSGIYLAQRNKKLSKYYLQEAKKLDKRKLLTPQVKEIEGMMKRI